MATKVLDSWALMAYFNGEPAGPAVKNILVKAETGAPELLLCVVNWGEIYYSVLRGGSSGRADLIAREIAGMPIEIVPVEADLELVRQAAIYKAGGGLAYADCFAAALAKIRNAELLTGDREFKALEKEIKIGWL